MLADKRLIITGVVRPDSTAWAIAAHAQQAGAQVLLTASPHDRDRTAAAASELPRAADVLDVDLTDDDDVHRLTEHLRGSWGGVDGGLHAVGPASRDALVGDLLDACADRAATAVRTRALTCAGLARVVRDLAPPGGGALLGLDTEAEGAWPDHGWAGVSTAALASLHRCLARDLGPRRIRSNLLVVRAPHARTTTDATPVAATACFLLSDLARAITGEVLHVDGSHHAVAAAQHDATAQHDAAPVTADPDDRRLARVFADLREHGISAHTGLRGDADQLRSRLHAHLVRRFPAGTAAFVFTTDDADQPSFTPTGTLRGPLQVHLSDPTLATLVTHLLTEAGLRAGATPDLTTLTLTPS